MSLSAPLPVQSTITLARVDWRFLLPSPQLGQVLVAGAPWELLAALQLVTDQVDVVDHLEPALSGGYDTVVLSRPVAADLATARDLLRPGGWLYAEVDRPPARWSHWLTTGLGPQWVRAARGVGLRGVQAHWYVEGPELATHLVPLNDTVALRGLTGRAQGSRLGTLKVLVLRLMVLVGAEGLAARHVALIGQRPAARS